MRCTATLKFGMIAAVFADHRYILTLALTLLASAGCHHDVPNTQTIDAGIADSRSKDTATTQDGPLDAVVTPDQESPVDAAIADQGVADQGVADQSVADQGVVDQGVADQGARADMSLSLSVVRKENNATGLVSCSSGRLIGAGINCNGLSIVFSGASGLTESTGTCDRNFKAATTLAYCVSPPLSAHVVEQNKSIPSITTNDVLQCAGNGRALTGGCHCTGTGGRVVESRPTFDTSTPPEPDGWRCRCSGPGMNIRVLCVPRQVATAINLSVKELASPTPATDQTSPVCGAGSVLIGGGCGTKGGDLLTSSLADAGKVRWKCTWIGSGSRRAFAFCASLKTP